ncbi:MAG: protein-disulfide reductase DsbD family protein [Chitinophagaceae bacterium]
MKKLIYFFCFLVISPGIRAQILQPVHWNFSAQPLPGNQFSLHMKATIDPGWHIYSQHAGNGPVPTSFLFNRVPAMTLIGKVEEKGNLEKKYDPSFQSTLNYYEHQVDFVQKVQMKGQNPGQVKGTLTFMVCNDQNCLPPRKIPFTISTALPGSSPLAITESSMGKGITIATKSAEPVVSDSTVATGGSSTATLTDSQSAASFAPEPDQDDASHHTLWWIFLASFGGGFLALLTPCVFSMIPITVSYFTKSSKTRKEGIRNAAYYALSIILIYTFLGFLITVFFGADALNNLASNIWANLIFFFIFILFALSFLGAFEISLPNSWANRADSRAHKGNFIGLFFMALTLVVVSFSCTGPIIGNLLVLAARGGKSGPLTGMFGFSLALAIPFALFAIFPSWLNKVGKAGGWLNTVKVTLGLLELALALKFLSNVDMAYHWGILSKEVFLSLWVVIFSLIGLYLLGKLKFPHDNDFSHVTIPRLFFAIASFAFVVYLIPGMFGADLKGITSGFIPNYSSYNFNFGSYGLTSSPLETPLILPKKYVNRFHAPRGYTTFFDYREALHAARVEKKPLMIDFTGWSCVNCRKMEAAVWSDPRVRKILNDDFVIVSLYVDDKTELPAKEQYYSKILESQVENLGNKNADFEATRYDRNSQPYYVFLDQNEKPLSAVGYSYDPDVQKFINFLEAVRRTYQQRNPS